MTDNGGTYSVSFDVHRPGKINVNIIKYTQGGVYADVYSNANWEGGLKSLSLSNIDFDWGSGSVFGQSNDNVSSKFYFVLEGPITGIVTIQLQANEKGWLYLDEALIVHSNYALSSSASIDMVSGKLYYGLIEFVETTGLADLKMFWSYEGQPLTIIPSSYFYSPSHQSSQQEIIVE